MEVAAVLWTALSEDRAGRRDEYMTLIMRDLENREIGIEEGRSQRDREIVEKMLKKGKTVEEIVDLCDFSTEFVESVQESLFVSQ